MEETSQNQRPLRLVGFCKHCRKPGFGFLLYGVGPFLCYNCGEAFAHKQNGQPTTTYPGVYSFTFTTSNSTSRDRNRQF